MQRSTSYIEIENHLEDIKDKIVIKSIPMLLLFVKCIAVASHCAILLFIVYVICLLLSLSLSLSIILSSLSYIDFLNKDAHSHSDWYRVFYERSMSAVNR